MLQSALRPLSLAACLLFATGSSPAAATQSAPPSAPAPVLSIGMSTALSGPAGDLGQEMRCGVKAAFAEYNRALAPGRGAVRLVALDDGYEPERCAPNMRQLIEQDKVLAVIGNVGTPTAIVAIPIANQSGTPFFGAFTGAGLLRKSPPERYVINYRASYAEETAAMVDALVDIGGIKPEEVAFFTQRDGYGDSGFNGGIEALRRHGLKNESAVAHGRYERNTLAVENALADILLARISPRAVIMVGVYAPCAEFIQRAREVGFHPLFLNVSFVGASSLARTLGDKGENVLATQVVPHFESDVPAVKDFRAALGQLDPAQAPSFGSLEGYVAGRIFCKALGTLAGTPTREQIVDALLGLGRFDIGLGTELELTPTRHQASHQVWPTVIRGGRVVPFEWSRLRELLPQD